MKTKAMRKTSSNDSGRRPATTGRRAAKRPSQAKARGQKRGSRAELDHTLNEWCIMTGRDSRTLLAAMRKVDIFPAPGQRIPFKWIESALFDEEYVEKVKAMKLDNKERERRDRERDGELVQMAEVEKMLTELVVVPQSSALRDLPTTMDTRCNPADPLLARRALTDWVEKTFKPLMRDKLPKPERTK